jgi:type IV secretory pathway VirJ component
MRRSIEWILPLLVLAASASVAQAAGPELRDLPLTEVFPKAGTAPAAGEGANTFVLLLTGDGGWAGLDKQVSASLAAGGIPVVGFNSLRYYWKPRTADEATAAVVRTIEHYSQALSRSRVVLVGYSFGADVLPFIVNRLPTQLRNRVDRIVLIGPSQLAAFEVKISGWIPGLAEKGEPLAPELAKLDVGKLLCIYGAQEPRSSCPALAQSGARSEQIGVGHHLGGEYDEVFRRISEFLR